MLRMLCVLVAMLAVGQGIIFKVAGNSEVCFAEEVSLFQWVYESLSAPTLWDVNSAFVLCVCVYFSMTHHCL
jgi:hypothetical protein